MTNFLLIINKKLLTHVKRLKRLDNITLAEKDEYKHKLDEIQTVCSSLMLNLHGGPQYGKRAG